VAFQPSNQICHPLFIFLPFAHILKMTIKVGINGFGRIGRIVFRNA
jgi:hypothetical protein